MGRLECCLAHGAEESIQGSSAGIMGFVLQFGHYRMGNISRVDVDESRACRIVARCSRVETGRTQGLDARFRRRCHQKSKHPASTMVDVHDHNVVRSNTTPPGIIHTSQPVLDGSCHSERRFLPMLLTSVHLWLGATFGAKTKQDFETRPLWTLGDCLSIDPGRGHYK